mmetsp:Transcript_7228/g.13448  ORF Transcript_7228/g.13448 Transcript_7228/m.13448 type:complete len:293 (+) Transcript_7228:1269-2147(+)
MVVVFVVVVVVVVIIPEEAEIHARVQTRQLAVANDLPDARAGEQRHAQLVCGVLRSPDRAGLGRVVKRLHRESQAALLLCILDGGLPGPRDETAAVANAAASSSRLLQAGPRLAPLAGFWRLLQDVHGELQVRLGLDGGYGLGLLQDFPLVVLDVSIPAVLDFLLHLVDAHSSKGLGLNALPDELQRVLRGARRMADVREEHQRVDQARVVVVELRHADGLEQRLSRLGVVVEACVQEGQVEHGVLERVVWLGLVVVVVVLELLVEHVAAVVVKVAVEAVERLGVLLVLCVV